MEINTTHTPHTSGILSVIAFAAAAFIAPQAEAQSQDIYFNDISDNNSTYINNPANWFTNPEKTDHFEGSLDGSQEAYISASGTLTTKIAANSTPIFGNLNYSLTEFNAGGDFITFGNDTFLQTSGNLVTNFTLSKESTTSYGQQLTQKITMWSNAQMRVGGDWLINVDRNGSLDYLSLRITDGVGSPGRASIQIDGNVISRGTLIFSTDNVNFTVNGAVDISGGQWNMLANNTQSEVFTRTVGGIGDADGSGEGASVRFNIAKENWVSASARTVNLVLTNSSSYEVSGSFAMYENSQDKLNITMSAADARNGRQALRFGSIGDPYWCNGMQLADANINNVEISSGRLDLGMHDGMKGANLSLYGYSGNAADAVFSAAGLSSGQEIGKVQFDSMTFYEGTIVFDIGEVDCDFIQINGGVTKDAPDSQIVFDINISKDDLQIYLDTLGAETLEWNLMSFKTDDSDFDLADIILKTQAGIDGELSFLADDSSGLTTVQLSLGVVPEPALAAAILGALALSLAAWRRRK